ncbi:MAG: carbohydrate ABC transporter permease [Lachnospiraceae bacterium]|nr:carbohydrate ABC transporter permease [Lachnospiraceae bacterium]
MNKSKNTAVKKKFRFSIRPIIAAILVIYTLFPIYWLISLSFRNNEELVGAVPLIPQSFSLKHYIALFTEKGFGVALKNSLQVTFIALIVSLAIGLCCAYVVARHRFRFRIKKPLTYWAMLVRVLPPVAFTIPLYIMFSRMGVLQSKIPTTLACIFINVPLIIWFMVNFFQELPEEVEESAKIDGASEWQLFIRIVLPLVAPGIAAIAMLTFMYAWNEYTYSVIFVQTPANYTVPLALAVLNTEDNLTQFGQVAAGGIISVIPIMLFVIFAQGYLLQGLSSGAVKE